MKRFLSFLLAALFCLMGSPAYAVFTREDYYAMGISALQGMTIEEAEAAVQDFSAAGNYLHAKNYEQYAQSLMEILRYEEEGIEDPDMSLWLLRDLAKSKEFSASLEEEGLPSCESLAVYLDARFLEEQGDYAAAWHCYASVSDILDSYKRKASLTKKAYEQGAAFYENGDYQAAAEALKDLDWKDSGDLFANVIAVLAPTPVPTPQPTQEPSLTQEPADTTDSPAPAAVFDLDLIWNAERASWDPILNGRMLPREEKAFVQELCSVLGLFQDEHIAEDDSLWSARWREDSIRDVVFTFRGVSFYPLSGILAITQDTGTGSRTQRIMHFALHCQDERAEEIIRQICSATPECHCNVYTEVGNVSDWNSLDPKKPDDLKTILGADYSTIFYIHANEYPKSYYSSEVYISIFNDNDYQDLDFTICLN
ncbi:MAG: hypothetical protein K6C06_06335 [Lachnospiraceae bacterium]|nr:hypothetical protein [Lachnospiraceae bacterium]